jgi:hypothetical protein
MRKMKRRILCIAVLLICQTMVFAQSPGFAKFKRTLKPQVGKSVTVKGTLRIAKLGYIVQFSGWGIYIYNIKDSDMDKMSSLSPFEGQTVRATGVLRYAPAPIVPPGDEPVALAPEHFYFDVAEAKVALVEKSLRTRRHKGYKTNQESSLISPVNLRLCALVVHASSIE